MSKAKVTLPKLVSEAIEYYWAKGTSNASIVATAVTNGSMIGHAKILVNFVLDSVGNSDILMSALVNGYEVELTPEDKLREYYGELYISASNEDPGTRAEYEAECKAEAVLRTLEILGITIAGVNAE
jgi:hypothetical protein